MKDFSIANRIKMLRKTLNLTQGEFAGKIGLKFSALSMIEREQVPITEQNIKLVCLTFNVNEIWLRTGEGDMFNKEKEISSYKQKLLDTFDKLSPRARSILLEYAEKIFQDELLIRNSPINPA
jgi:transcriptional regulator with XRE-family HTH domain